MKSAYEMCVNNTARYLRSLPESERQTGGNFDAFQAAKVLAIAFAKQESDVVSDLLINSLAKLSEKSGTAQKLSNNLGRGDADGE